METLKKYKFFNIDFAYTCKDLSEKLQILSVICKEITFNDNCMLYSNTLTLSFNDDYSLVALTERDIERLAERLIYLNKTDFINSIKLLGQTKLNDENTAIIIKEGLKVGCQVIPYDTIQILVDKLKKAKLIK